MNRHSICPICNDSGWQIIGEGEQQRAVRCQCFLKKRTDRLLQEARIPRRYQHCTLKNFKTPKQDDLWTAKGVAKDFVKDYPNVDMGILFIGPCGVGKTHLAVGIMKELIEKKGMPCLFYDFRDLLREIQDSYNPISESSELRVLAPVLKTEVLLLDELGARRPTDWVKETIDHILNSRYNDKKITIITSNFLDKPKEKDHYSLEQRIGSRLRSRLYEMCRTVEMNADDYRKKFKPQGFNIIK
ncbi:MAG: ATP-binding protein [Acidobacteriota bacterium]